MTSAGHTKQSTMLPILIDIANSHRHHQTLPRYQSLSMASSSYLIVVKCSPHRGFRVPSSCLLTIATATSTIPHYHIAALS